MSEEKTVVKKVAKKKTTKKVAPKTQLKELTVEAVIPVCQYGNVQPKITVTSNDFDEAQKYCMDKVSAMFKQYADVKLNNEKPAETTNTVEAKKVKSFNENIEVDFYPEEHEFFCDGEKMLSATNYVKKYYKPFDAENIAKACAKSWNATEEEIKALWNINGNVSAGFGTAVHAWLEFYFTYREVGERIMEARNAKKPGTVEFNPAIPKHPIGYYVVTNLINLIKEEQGKCLCEVFVTDSISKRCGFIDRLLIVDEAKKICRIQDYKVNIGSEEVSSKNKPFGIYAEYEASKITKYHIQLSFYADILRKSGWTVEGIDFFILEQTWKKISRDNILPIE